jgi:EAL domain-containing protein (putative c-di-GMP-specific phosphodiesterase class I)
MMIEIDRQVMGLAMGQIAAWREQGLDPGTLALNLTLSHLGTKDFFDNLKSQMGVFDFRPEWLELEITENEAMKNHEEAIKKLRQISRMGIRVAVDDFGKGHSSLAYLKRLPIDRLKIDRSFVQDIPKGPADAAIIKAIISLTKHLDLDVIAEGVERPEQRDFLLENGCDVVQGFLCGKPMPAEKMESLLREQQTKEKA